MEINEMDITVIWKDGNSIPMKPLKKELKKFRFARDLFEWLAEHTTANNNLLFDYKKQTLEIMF
jgi:hypothetical protein